MARDSGLAIPAGARTEDPTPDPNMRKTICPLMSAPTVIPVPMQSPLGMEMQMQTMVTNVACSKTCELFDHDNDCCSLKSIGKLLGILARDSIQGRLAATGK